MAYKLDGLRRGSHISAHVTDDSFGATPAERRSWRYTREARRSSVWISLPDAGFSRGAGRSRTARVDGDLDVVSVSLVDNSSNSSSATVCTSRQVESAILIKLTPRLHCLRVRNEASSPRGTESLRPLRWREKDSNPQSRVRERFSRLPHLGSPDNARETAASNFYSSTARYS